MTELDYEDGDLIADVPLFPLPSLVFFPGTLLPLHIFEPRYRAMTENVLAQREPLMCVGMIDAPPGSEQGLPPVVQVVGLGRIIEHQRLDDGRFNIVLAGLARVRIDELPFVPPFRRVRATVLGDLPRSVPESDRAALVSAATRFLAAATGGNADFDFRMPSSADPGAAADLCAHQLIVDAADRQRVLETLDVRVRVALCAEILATQEALLRQDRVLH